MCRMQSTRFEKMVYTDVPSKGGSEVWLRRIVRWILSRLEFCGTDKSVRSATLIGFKLKLIGASCLKSMNFLGHFHDVFWYMGVSLYRWTVQGLGCCLAATYGACIFAQTPSKRPATPPLLAQRPPNFGFKHLERPPEKKSLTNLKVVRMPEFSTLQQDRWTICVAMLLCSLVWPCCFNLILRGLSSRSIMIEPDVQQCLPGPWFWTMFAQLTSWTWLIKKIAASLMVYRLIVMGYGLTRCHWFHLEHENSQNSGHVQEP